MIKVPLVGESLDKRLKKKEIRLAHWPNGMICWAVKNLIGEVRYFDVNGMFPSKSCVRFSKSKSRLY